ncbi:cation diffusion facilitator CzcD-associated flavoprotein CzcO [Spinactinospora alkalitolerans]|uniref:Cation diffusion facilitator CzcD-associated flavoprotein CzcO n=1 Tax=Spinactinospora alkalitolerans TaxID=687207 RepID=A0A852TW36_9ACTN|nr:NAD(P)/FAD-dependent oxidoreductase [Spinactinospora alkalitolerans]NYE47605.1 cation diffusion facilitator CzcD-associated flavoprotein CzcO [Spinactinospora alkalitolerans]
MGSGKDASTAPPRSAAPGPRQDAAGGDGTVRHVRVAAIGAGFGGLGLAVRLRQAGITDFTVLERADSVGGTWRDNTYPGCACDVPSHLYSFSFAPNPHWPRSFSGQPHIRAYLEEVTERHGLRPHLEFDSEVLEARWDAAAARWHVRTSRSELTCDVLVSASGALSDPAIPDIPGIDAFPGTVFHSARWDHDTDLTGKRVAVVGTGASAIQIVPSIQPEVERLVLLQRTPAWVMPRADRRITRAEQWMYRNVPLAQRISRSGIYLTRESSVGAFVRFPALLRLASGLARRHLRRAVKDPGLRAKLTPDFTMGCKRILLSNDYYPALARPNVDVVASGLAEVRGSTVVAADGTEHEVDAIVFGTGFQVTDMPIGERVFGAAGRSLAQEWRSGMQALRGTAVAGFPNFFTIVGPNTGLGHTSMIFMIESQLNYVIDALRRLEAPGVAAIEPKPEAQRAWNDDLHRRMGRTVWSTGGCASWYLDANGRNTTLWPGSTMRFRRATRRLKPSEYSPIAPPASPPTAPAAAPEHTIAVEASR